MSANRMASARRAVLAVMLAGGLAVAHSASATPNSVGQYHDDTGTAVVRGTDGLTYQVSFELQATAGNPSQAAVATVSYKACKRNGSCGFTYTYQLSLTGSQVAFPDPNTATITTKLLGQPLRLRWVAHPSTPASSFSVQANIPDTIAVGDPTSGGPADFTATFFGTACGGRGMVTNEYGVFTSPAAGSATGSSRLPAGFVAKRGHKPGCQSSA